MLLDTVALIWSCKTREIQVFFLYVLIISMLSMSWSWAADLAFDNDDASISVMVLSKEKPDSIVVTSEGERWGVDLDTSLPLIINPTFGKFTVELEGGSNISRTYYGSLLIDKIGSELLIVNITPLKRYIASVVISEMAWSSNEAMLAQAVLVATYAINKKNINSLSPLSKGVLKRYDLSDLAYDQVYTGASLYEEKFYQRIKNRHVQLIHNDGKLIDAVYHAECGSKVLSAEQVWGRAMPSLTNVFIDKDELKGQLWQVAIERGALDKIFETDFGSYTLTKRDEQLGVKVNDDWYGIDEFRLSIDRALGWNTLPSNEFTLEVNARDVVFVGRGRGHLVGMCQNLAIHFSKKGWGLKKILLWFYPFSDIKEFE